jgi:hypothetical protein
MGPLSRLETPGAKYPVNRRNIPHKRRPLLHSCESLNKNETRDSCHNDYEECRLLRCDTSYSGIRVYTDISYEPDTCIINYPHDRGSRFVRKVCTFLANYTVLSHKRELSTTKTSRACVQNNPIMRSFHTNRDTFTRKADLIQ